MKILLKVSEKLYLLFLGAFALLLLFHSASLFASLFASSEFIFLLFFLPAAAFFCAGLFLPRLRSLSLFLFCSALSIFSAIFLFITDLHTIHRLTLTGSLLLTLLILPVYLLSGALLKSIYFMVHDRRAPATAVSLLLGGFFAGVLFFYTQELGYPPSIPIVVLGCAVLLAACGVCLRRRQKRFNPPLLLLLISALLLTVIGAGTLVLLEVQSFRLEERSGNRLVHTRTIPDKLTQRDLMPALFAALQPDRTGIAALLIVSGDSPMPFAFSVLKIANPLHVIYPTPYELSGEQSFRLLPQEISRIWHEPRRHLEKTGQTYDLIFLDVPLPSNILANRFYTEEFYRTVRAHLSPSGVFATYIRHPGSFKADFCAELDGIQMRTLRKVFRDVHFLPGRENLAAASDSPFLTGDFNVLDQRLSSLFPNNELFPEKLFSIVSSQQLQQKNLHKAIGNSISAGTNGDMNPALPSAIWERENRNSGGITGFFFRIFDFCVLYWIWILGGGLALYWVLRYFISWRPVHKKSFILLENGFFSCGMLMICFYLSLVRNGYEFHDFALMLAFLLFSAIAPDLFQPRTPNKFAPIARLVACLLPAAAYLLIYTGSDVTVWAIPLLSALTGLAAGYIHREQIRSGTERGQMLKLFAVELLGAAAAIPFFPGILIPGHVLPALAVLLILTRIIRVLAKP